MFSKCNSIKHSAITCSWRRLLTSGRNQELQEQMDLLQCQGKKKKSFYLQSTCQSCLVFFQPDINRVNFEQLMLKQFNLLETSRSISCQWETSTHCGLNLYPVFVWSCSTAAPPGLPHALLEGHSGLLLQHHGVGGPVREVHECGWKLCDAASKNPLRIFLFFFFVFCSNLIVSPLVWSDPRSSSWMWRTSCELPPTSPAASTSGRRQKWSSTTGNRGRNTRWGTGGRTKPRLHLWLPLSVVVFSPHLFCLAINDMLKCVCKAYDRRQISFLKSS